MVHIRPHDHSSFHNTSGRSPALSKGQNRMSSTATHMAVDGEDRGMSDTTATSKHKGAAPLETDYAHMPLCCQLDPQLKMFRLIRSKGKALFSGGFGVTITSKKEKEHQQCAPDVATNGADSDKLDANGTRNGIGGGNGGNGDAACFDQPQSSSTAVNVGADSDANVKPGQQLQHQLQEQKQQQESNPQEYLFAEEAVFLYERGLLFCLRSDASPHEADSQHPPAMEMSEIYAALETCGVSLPVYLVYAHLRGQDFRVLRHHPERHQWLQQQCAIQKNGGYKDGERKKRKLQHEGEAANDSTHHENKPASTSDTSTQPQPQHSAKDAVNIADGNDESIANEIVDDHDTTTEISSSGDNKTVTARTTDNGSLERSLPLRELKRRVRQTIQHAPIPQVLGGTTALASASCEQREQNQQEGGDESLSIAWDVYMPESQFAKTSPGLPSFYVAITHFNVPGLSFSNLQQLLRAKTNGLPLKLASVSDSGTVIMFGVTDFGVPSISTSIEA